MLIVYKKYPMKSCALQMMANYEVAPAAILFSTQLNLWVNGKCKILVFCCEFISHSLFYLYIKFIFSYAFNVHR